ncbi:MAG: TIGR00725 family protein [Leptospiraceae bacterium]|nr:TIGR00725 family protein [Leptospiraceae bacterium]
MAKKKEGLMKIGVIGPNTSICSDELYEFGRKIGECLAEMQATILCGGMGGFMESVCRGAKESKNTYNGQTIGILPGEDDSQANPYIDISISTGMGIARNIIIVNSSELLIAGGGGAGTLSEIAFAWQKGKTVLCLQGFGGWSEELAGRDLDKRKKNLLVSIETIENLHAFIKNYPKR